MTALSINRPHGLAPHKNKVERAASRLLILPDFAPLAAAVMEVTRVLHGHHEKGMTCAQGWTGIMPGGEGNTSVTQCP